MNSYKLFSEPRKTFEFIFNELEKAKRSIYIDAYQIGDDSIGHKLMKILAKKAEKIKVIVIVDDYGFSHPSKKMHKLIEDSNIEFNLFNPVIRPFRERQWSKLGTQLTTRSHRKLTIIDERVAYTGGTNYTAEELKWRDTFVRIVGPLVTDLTKSFFEMRRITRKKRFQLRPINKRLTKKFKNTDILIRQIPHSRHKPLRRELRKMFAKAKEEICISTPYFIPDAPFLHMLHKALKRAVKVKIIIPRTSDDFFADFLTDFFANVAFLNGCEVYLYKRMSHAKYAIVDRKMCTIGSANFDYQTFHKNYEINVMSKNEKLSKELYQVFEEDCKNSIRFTSKNRKNRSFWRRVVERILHRYRRYF